MQFPTFKTLLFVALTAGLAVACGGLARKGSTDESGSGLQTTPPGQRGGPPSFPGSHSEDSVANIPTAPTKTPEDPQFVAERTKIMGMWVKNCVPGGAGETSSRAAIEFTKTEFNVYVFNYQDNNCQIQSSQTRIEGRYNFALSDNGVNPIDMNYGEKIYYRFFTDKALREANSNKVCARSSWVQGMEYGCAQEGAKLIYNIVKATDQSLSLGLLSASRDGSSRDKRPSALDEAGAYQKKK